MAPLRVSHDLADFRVTLDVCLVRHAPNEACCTQDNGSGDQFSPFSSICRVVPAGHWGAGAAFGIGACTDDGGMPLP
jgi:hypothetical protein